METTSLPQAWIVDDDPILRQTLDIALGDDFGIRQIGSGEDALALLTASDAGPAASPELLLLDIEMGMLDGYETCRRLRAAGFDMPVIFVSGHDTLEEHLQAFGVGGDDFISKPFDPELVLHKARRAVARYLEIRESEAGKAALLETTQRILHEADETGVLLAFLRETLRMTDYAELATRLMHAVEAYGIQCQVQIRCEEGPLTITPSGLPTALELSIFERAIMLGREFRMGRRMIINYDFVSLFVINMPKSDEEAQRLAAYLNVLTESAEAIAETIGMRRESAARAEALMIGTAQSYSAIEELRDGYRKQQADTHLLLQELIDEVEKTYVHLGLTDRQEDTVSMAMRQSAEKILHLFEQGATYDQQFAAILDSLQPSSGQNATEVWL